MTDRKSGKSKKKHKEQAEKINLREAAEVLKAAEKKIAPRRAAKPIDHEAEVIYAPEPMPVPEAIKVLAPEPIKVLEAEPIKQPVSEPPPPSRALVTLPKTNGEDEAASFQQSFDAAQKGAHAVNAKLIEMAQEAMNANFEYARDLAGATNPMQALKLQMKHWQEAIESFTAQAEELRKLTAELVAATSEPIRAHFRAQAAQR